MKIEENLREFSGRNGVMFNKEDLLIFPID